jgi:hypothetical protein
MLIILVEGKLNDILFYGIYSIPFCYNIQNKVSLLKEKNGCDLRQYF